MTWIVRWLLGLIAVFIAGCAPDAPSRGTRSAELQRNIGIGVPHASHYPGERLLDYEPSAAPVRSERHAARLAVNCSEWNVADRNDIEAAARILASFVDGFVFLEVETTEVDGAVRNVARFRHSGSWLSFILVPGFNPRMKDESEIHWRDDAVAPLLMAEHEVTVDEWRRIRARGGAAAPADEVLDDGGAAVMRWQHAAAFCLELELQLPTEAEWEHAVFGGRGRVADRRPVDTTPFGLKRLVPGRWEWTQSWPRRDAGAAWRAVALSRSGQRSLETGLETFDRLLVEDDDLSGPELVHLRPVARLDRAKLKPR